MHKNASATLNTNIDEENNMEKMEWGRKADKEKKIHHKGVEEVRAAMRGEGSRSRAARRGVEAFLRVTSPHSPEEEGGW